jgi:hypothetical protein
MDEDVREFFGASSILSFQTNLWTADDTPSGQSILHHYQCHTIPRLGTDINNADTQAGGSAIPPFIHFIWLGDKQLPLVVGNDDDDDDENVCIRSWRHYHPHWMVQVWTDSDVLQEHHMTKWFNKEALEYAIRHKNYGMASDILRLELLFEHGGLYVDIDYLCVASVADLHRQFDFYCGASNAGAIELNNGLMASQPRHGLIQNMMERIRDWSMQVIREQSLQQAAMLHIAAFLDKDDTDKSRALLEHGIMDLTPEQVIRHTGPGLLTSTVAQILTTTTAWSSSVSSNCDLSRVAVLPYQVFHPLPNYRRRLGLETLNEELLEAHIVPGETKAVHLWQCSWQEGP